MSSGVLRRVGGVVTVVAAAVAVGAQSAPVRVGTCVADVPDGWTAAGNTFRLKRYEEPEAVIDMSSDFERIPSDPSIVLLARALPTGATHFRSVTQTRPACATSVVAQTAAAAAAGREIARSIRIDPPPPPSDKQ